MEIELEVSYSKINKADMETLLYEARVYYGIKPCEKIPSQIYDFQMALLTVMFEIPKSAYKTRGG